MPTNLKHHVLVTYFTYNLKLLKLVLVNNKSSHYKHY